jgi:DNA-binding PadR family transcriptional regulator
MDTKTLCLAVLQSGPASGYEIKKTLESAPYSHFQDTSFGALYPALARLAEDGLIDASAQAQDKRPDKKVYSLTTAGRAALIEALMREPAPDKYRSDFLLVLFLGDLLPQGRVIEVIDTRIADLEKEAQRMRECDLGAATAAQRFVHAYGLAYYEFAAGWLRDNRSRLAAELQDGARGARPDGNGPEKSRTAAKIAVEG